MATYSCSYIDIWKWLQFDWWSTWILYWDDFNPTDQSDYDADHCTVYQATTSFNLSWFQPWHEVWACTWEIKRDWPWSALTQTVWMDFERYDGNWHIAWDLRYSVNRNSIIESQSSRRWWWCYFWIDKDEIRPWYSKYRVHVYASDGTWSYYSPEFTVSSLSIDSTLHPAWYLWIEWSHLCYTDNTWDEIWQNWYGYKHKIAYDNSYSYNVWSSNKWYIWLDTDNSLRIYYVDAVWVRRRTYASKERYGWDVRVWSSNKWYIWVGVQRAEDWYWHLCFIAPNGSKRRILNWPPAWYE